MECYFTNQKVDNNLILDEIVIIYQQQKYLTIIIEIKPIVKCQIIKVLSNSNFELPCKITLVMSLLKEQKFDLVIQKAVELGVYQIVPLYLKRCVSILTKEKAQQKILRWQNIAKSVAKQSNRDLIPLITPVVFNLKDLAKYNCDLNLVADENASDVTWTSKINSNLKTITVLIGPEGGISSDEITVLKSLGFTSISLGKLILRAETAPLFLMSIINYETNLKNKGEKHD